METVKSISRIGNSFGVIIPPEMLKELGVSKKSRVKLVSNDGVITIEPTGGREEKVMKAAAKYVKKYREDFKKLAR